MFLHLHALVSSSEKVVKSIVLGLSGEIEVVLVLVIGTKMEPSDEYLKQMEKDFEDFKRILEFLEKKEWRKHQNITVGELPDFHFKCEKSIAILLNARVDLLEKKNRIEEERDELKDQLEIKNSAIINLNQELVRLKDKYKQISGLYHPLLIDHLELTRKFKEGKAQQQVLKFSFFIFLFYFHFCDFAHFFLGFL